MTKTERDARAADLAEISENLRDFIAAWVRGQDGRAILGLLSLIELQHQQVADLEIRIEHLEQGLDTDARFRSLEDRLESLESAARVGADGQRY